MVSTNIRCRHCPCRRAIKRSPSNRWRNSTRSSCLQRAPRPFNRASQLSADNAPVVADICARLDGVPLAIELATAQLRRFTPQALLDALKTTPLQSLAGAARDVEPRQRTLRNAIQWSYDLLTPAERAAFDRLGVFVGGCTTEAALAICQLADDSILFSLADRSLLRRDANERWTMLEMIREFALERLLAGAERPSRCSNDTPNILCASSKPC